MLVAHNKTSMESSRQPILNNRDSKKTSNRVSTYSMAPTTASQQSNNSTSTDVDVKSYQLGHGRLEDKRMANQRYTVSAEKQEDLAQLALEGKVQRALNRRFTGQDAVMKVKKPLSEKPSS